MRTRITVPRRAQLDRGDGGRQSRHKGIRAGLVHEHQLDGCAALAVRPGSPPRGLSHSRCPAGRPSVRARHDLIIPALAHTLCQYKSVHCTYGNPEKQFLRHSDPTDNSCNPNHRHLPRQPHAGFTGTEANVADPPGEAGCCPTAGASERCGVDRDDHTTAVGHRSSVVALAATAGSVSDPPAEADCGPAPATSELRCVDDMITRLVWATVLRLSRPYYRDPSGTQLREPRW